MTRVRVLLVASAAPDEGGGHVSRAVAIAQALAALDADVSLRTLRGSPGAAQLAVLTSLGVRMTSGDGRPSADHHAAVVDLPNPDEAATWFDPARLVAFDDSERLRCPAAVVVQPSLPAWHGPARAGRVLAGYAWAPIRAGLLELIDRPAAATPSGLVVCFGGSDPADVAARIVPDVADAVRARVGAARCGAASSTPDGTTVILGAGYRGSLAAGPTWDVLHDPSDIDLRLANARLALIGAGTMKFELAVLGVPTLTVAVADDQLRVGPAFAATGASQYLGDGRTLEPLRVADAAVALLDDAPRLEAMRSAARAAVDGCGAQRLAEVILNIGRAAG
jgi:spore coat polysaccharide biosynthesis predicted glycosyltransferase SpsG